MGSIRAAAAVPESSLLEESAFGGQIGNLKAAVDVIESFGNQSTFFRESFLEISQLLSILFITAASSSRPAARATSVRTL